MTRPTLLIENWFPIAEIGAESMRERGASSALPPLYFLHVWWARRPLTASRAAILASALPAWSADFPPALHTQFPNEQKYHDWFLHLIGVRGDPVRGQKLIRLAKSKGIKLAESPYAGAPRAFTVNPENEDLKTLGDLLQWTWGTRHLKMLDPFAGGGSIPFEALRFGFDTYANDLNPVAAVILKATLEYPARFGPSLSEEILKWGNLWAKRVKENLAPYFPRGKDENIFAYLWARTIIWKGRTIPLSPNWWLATGDKPSAIRLIIDPNTRDPQFEILSGDILRKAVNEGYDPDDGTISHGVARDPWSGETIDGDFIKSEAQAGRMGQVLYAIAQKKSGGFEFRLPTKEDIAASMGAEEALAKKRGVWEVQGIVPTEAFPEGNDNRPLMYGMPTWADFFSKRQLLSIGVFIETLKEILNESKTVLQQDKQEAISLLLSLAVSKATDRNALLSTWIPQRQVIGHVFQRHDFAFVWAYAEFDASSNLLSWTIDQVTDAYKGLAELSFSTQSIFQKTGLEPPVDRLIITKGSAAQLVGLSEGSVRNITVDPPYYDNVMYAELSDFFYVWLKRSLGPLFPEFFRDELTNKDDEAISNPARFAALGKKKKQLANDDYERKMAAAFCEMYRVLHDDGVVTIMFTHKRVEAWDTLASALIGAGFSIEASWPVHTEFEHSLHQAKKNAASSTIMLVCRKRVNKVAGVIPVFWDDLHHEVRRIARERASEYSKMGIGGADLYISTFGPVLSVISKNWPILTSEVDAKSGQPRTLRPETALDLAREEVTRLRKEGLLAGRPVQFDGPTDWYLLAWDAYAAEQFPYDEARKMAVALGVDLDHDLMQIKRLASKKGEFITLSKPVDRRKNGMVDEDLSAFPHWVDAVHTAMMIYSEDGAGACEAFLMRTGLKRDPTFKALLQALINAIPRNRIKGHFVRPEAETLDNIRLAFYDDLTVPAEEELDLPQWKQGDFVQPADDELDEGAEDD
jgi:putative DNA methylase